MQISEEEKRAIEFLKFYKEQCLNIELKNLNNYETINDEEFVGKNLETILNLIEKQNKELMLNKLGEIGKQGCLKCKTVENVVNLRRDNIKLKQEIRIKDKMIDEIIAYLFNITGFRLLIKENGFCENIEKCINDDEKCFKEYFRKKVEENGKDRDKRGLEELG